jgi:hypothetical protein
MAAQRSQNDVWDNIGRAIGTEPREHRRITGVSGIEHPVLHLSVDDKNKRMLLVSSEPDPRTCALVYGDVQAAMPDVRILMARPIAIDLNFIFSRASQLIGKDSFTQGEVKAFFKTLERYKGRKKPPPPFLRLAHQLKPVGEALSRAPLSATAQFITFIQQAATIDWVTISETLGDEDAEIAINFNLEYDSLAADRSYGVCPVPLYEWAEDDWRLFGPEFDEGAAIERLKALDIYQYFFPALDQTALGLIDRGVSDPNALPVVLGKSQELGHPPGQLELLPPDTDVQSILSGLHELGLVVEGELGLSASKEGQEQRLSIKFRPREGWISKMLSAFKLNVNINS